MNLQLKVIKKRWLFCKMEMSIQGAIDFLTNQIKEIFLIVDEMKQSLDRIENKINENKGWR